MPVGARPPDFGDPQEVDPDDPHDRAGEAPEHLAHVTALTRNRLDHLIRAG